MIKPQTVYAEEMSLFTDSSIYKRIAFILAIVGLTVQFLSFLSPFWISKTFKNGTTINVGLWLTCVDLDCTGISDSPGKLNAIELGRSGKTLQRYSVRYTASFLGNVTSIKCQIKVPNLYLF
jgi:hypothetical protein